MIDPSSKRPRPSNFKLSDWFPDLLLWSVPLALAVAAGMFVGSAGTSPADPIVHQVLKFARFLGVGIYIWGVYRCMARYQTRVSTLAAQSDETTTRTTIGSLSSNNSPSAASSTLGLRATQLVAGHGGLVGKLEYAGRTKGRRTWNIVDPHNGTARLKLLISGLFLLDIAVYDAQNRPIGRVRHAGIFRWDNGQQTAKSLVFLLLLCIPVLGWAYLFMILQATRRPVLVERDGQQIAEITCTSVRHGTYVVQSDDGDIGSLALAWHEGLPKRLFDAPVPTFALQLAEQQTHLLPLASAMLVAVYSAIYKIGTHDTPLHRGPKAFLANRMYLAARRSGHHAAFKQG